MLVDLLTKSSNLLLQTLPGLSECECQKNLKVTRSSPSQRPPEDNGAGESALSSVSSNGPAEPWLRTVRSDVQRVVCSICRLQDRGSDPQIPVVVNVAAPRAVVLKLKSHELEASRHNLADLATAALW